MSDLTLQITVCVLLGISLFGVLAAILLFATGFEPLIIVAVFAQLGSVGGYILLWVLKALDWNVPMTPLTIGTTAVLPFIIIMIGEKAWFQFAKAPAIEVGTGKTTAGSRHPLTDLPSDWIIPAVIVYNLCNLWIIGSILLPMLWKA